MNNPRLYVDANLLVSEDFILPSDVAHYVGNVLRLGVGDEVTLFNGNGGEFPAEIVAASRKQVQVKVLRFDAREAESTFAIHLVQGISKGERMDLVVQKAVELGVSRITPVFTEFGVVHLEGERLLKKAEHWRGIVRSACEQCRRNRVPTLDDPLPLQKWLQSSPSNGALRLVLAPEAGAGLRQLSVASSGASLLIGPEGGLSRGEVEMANGAGFLSVRLGARILRTETAAIAAISAMQTLFGDMG